MFLHFHGNLLNSQFDIESRVMTGYKSEVSYIVHNKKKYCIWINLLSAFLRMHIEEKGAI